MGWDPEDMLFFFVSNKVKSLFTISLIALRELGINTKAVLIVGLFVLQNVSTRNFLVDREYSNHVMSS